MLHTTLLRFVAFGFLAATVGSASADSAKIRIPLGSTGADADARATLTAVLNEQQSMVMIAGSKFTANQEYGLYASGQLVATKAASSSGALKFMFRNPSTVAAPALRFDPRGSVLEIRQGAVTLFSSAGEPTGSSLTEQASLKKVSASKKSTASYRLSSQGKRQFSVTASGLSGTNWGVYVDGVRSGSLKVKGSSGTARFGSSPTSTEQPLDFDPRGKVLDIRKDGTNAYTGMMESRARDLNYAEPSVQFGYIPATDAAGEGTAKGKFRVKSNAEQQFSLEVEKVPVGDYDLLVDGVYTAVIRVTASDDEDHSTEGEVEFAANSDDEDKLPLTFDPLAATFAIQQGQTLFFSGPLTQPSPGGGSEPVEIEERLTSAGLDAEASGVAHFEIDEDGERSFSVEIEDVPVGTYELWVDGVRRGTFEAAQAEDEVKGEIEFSTGDDNDELPLDFDPRGLLVEVRNQEGTWFSHLFGFGGSGPDTVAPVEIRTALINLGVVNGTAKMKYEREDDGETSFEVELEGVSAGDYALFVDGVQAGTITASLVDGRVRGKIEFETDDEDGELPLNFDPLGKTISLQFNGVTAFERLLE